MNRDQQQNTHRRTQSLWKFACLSALTLSSSLSLGQQTNDPEQPSSWYQVEVVIFTQQGYIGNEQPPRKYTLDFPEKYVELRDTGYIGSNYPQINYDATRDSERAIPLAIVEDPALTFSSAILEFDNLSPEPLATPLLVTSVAIDQPSAKEPVYIPEYEKPFVKLDKQYRDLNESTRALDRRAKYNVVFHEAWRFSADENADDPWVIIKAGKHYQDRYEIEGSLRFYKSRFLHFQSDLWLLGFDDPNESATMIKLPAFPEIPLQSLSDGRETLEIAIDESEVESLFFDAPPAQIQKKKNKPKELRTEMDAEIEAVDPELPTSYPISTLWIFDQSKRLEKQQSYYLDHPKMGILVTIKSHEVEITNPPEDIESADAKTIEPNSAQ